MVEVDPHGVNDGSGATCTTHSYASIDENHLSEKRIASLTLILNEKYGVTDPNLIKALCALGEGMFFTDVVVWAAFCCMEKNHNTGHDLDALWAIVFFSLGSTIL